METFDDDRPTSTRSSKRTDPPKPNAERCLDTIRSPSPVPTGDASSRQFDSPRGVFDLASGEKRFRLARYHPSAELGYFVEYYWVVEWDLRGQADHQQESLPHPAVHITVERERAEVVGVVEGRFVKILQGNGRVFGIKFWPGGFYPLFGAPVSGLTNRVVSVSEVFGEAGKVFGNAVAACAIDQQSVELAEGLLRTKRPARDENVVVVRGIVEKIKADTGITKVDDLAPVDGISKRTLQRLFQRYVGVSAKWVIQRYRLHEAIEAIEQGHSIDWARLAIDLGYYDQAHFIKDFKRFAGRTPDDYARGLVNGKPD